MDWKTSDKSLIQIPLLLNGKINYNGQKMYNYIIYYHRKRNQMLWKLTYSADSFF